MKMLKNELEADASAISRIPIPSPPSTKRGVVLRYVAHPPARPVPDPHAEDGAGAVAVAVAVDEDTGLRKTEKKGYKNRGLPATVPKCVAVADTRWLGNTNVPRLDDHRVDVGSRVGLCRTLSLSKKASSC